MDTTNQIALITGAGNGIGRAIAIAMGENQRNVVCADIDLDAAQITANTIRQLGVEATAVRVDVGETLQISEMVQEVKKEFGRLDILVNNAGVTRAADIMELTEGDWDRIHRVNAKGVFFILLQSQAVVLREHPTQHILQVKALLLV